MGNGLDYRDEANWWEMGWIIWMRLIGGHGLDYRDEANWWAWAGL